MELRHLRYFVAVAEELNITRAAERLHVSQPPLSRQIRDLEEELGVVLLERSPQRVVLTHKGAVFLKDARAVLKLADEAVQRVQSEPGGMKGDLRIGYSPNPTIELLPKALKAFHKTTPGVRTLLHDAASDELLAALLAGTMDVLLGVAFAPKVAAAQGRGRVKYLPIGPEPCTIPVGFAVRKGKLSGALAAFVEVLQRFAEKPKK